MKPNRLLTSAMTRFVSISLLLTTTLTLAAAQYPASRSIIRRPASRSLTSSGQQLQYQPLRVSSPRRLTASQQVQLRHRQFRQQLAGQGSGLSRSASFLPQSISRAPYSMLSRLPKQQQPQQQQQQQQSAQQQPTAASQQRRSMVSQAGRIRLPDSIRYTNPQIRTMPSGNRFVSAGGALTARRPQTLPSTLGQQSRYLVLPRTSRTNSGTRNRQLSTAPLRAAHPAAVAANNRVLSSRQLGPRQTLSRAPVVAGSQSSPRVLRVLSPSAYQQLLRRQSPQRIGSSPLLAQSRSPLSRTELMLRQQQDQINQQLQRLQVLIQQQQQQNQQQQEISQAQEPTANLSSGAMDAGSQTVTETVPINSSPSNFVRPAAAEVEISPTLGVISGTEAAASVNAGAAIPSDNMVISHAQEGTVGVPTGKGSDLFAPTDALGNTVTAAGNAKIGDQGRMMPVVTVTARGQSPQPVRVTLEMGRNPYPTMEPAQGTTTLQKGEKLEVPTNRFVATLPAALQPIQPSSPQPTPAEIVVPAENSFGTQTAVPPQKLPVGADGSAGAPQLSELLAPQGSSAVMAPTEISMENSETVQSSGGGGGGQSASTMGVIPSLPFPTAPNSPFLLAAAGGGGIAEGSGPPETPTETPFIANDFSSQAMLPTEYVPAPGTAGAIDAASSGSLMVSPHSATIASGHLFNGKQSPGPSPVYEEKATNGELSPLALLGQTAMTAQNFQSAGRTVPVLSAGSTIPFISAGSVAPAISTGSKNPAVFTESEVPVSPTGNAAPVTTAGTAVPLMSAGNTAPVTSAGSASAALSTGSVAPVLRTGSETAPIAPVNDASTFGQTGISDVPLQTSSLLSTIAHVQHGTAGTELPIASVNQAATGAAVTANNNNNNNNNMNNNNYVPVRSTSSVAQSSSATSGGAVGTDISMFHTASPLTANSLMSAIMSATAQVMTEHTMGVSSAGLGLTTPAPLTSQVARTHTQPPPTPAPTMVEATPTVQEMMDWMEQRAAAMERLTERETEGHVPLL